MSRIYLSKQEISPKLKCPQNWNITKTVMSPKLKYHQIWNVTKTEVLPKLNCHQNWSVIQTEMLLKLKCYHTLYLSSKITNLNSRDWHWIPRSCFTEQLVIHQWVEDDTKSTKGGNITERSSIQEVEVEDIEKLVYHKVKEERQWRVELVELLLLAREEEGLEDSWPWTVRVALHWLVLIIMYFIFLTSIRVIVFQLLLN